MIRWVCWSRESGWCGKVHESPEAVADHLIEELNRGEFTDRHPYALDPQGRVLGPDDEVLDVIPVREDA